MTGLPAWRCATEGCASIVHKAGVRCPSCIARAIVLGSDDPERELTVAVSHEPPRCTNCEQPRATGSIFCNRCLDNEVAELLKEIP